MEQNDINIVIKKGFKWQVNQNVKKKKIVTIWEHQTTVPLNSKELHFIIVLLDNPLNKP